MLTSCATIDPVLWPQLTDCEPELAAACRRLLAERHGYSYLATVAAGNAPRIHPVAPILVASGLFIAIRRDSPKRGDLLRNPPLALHASVVPPDDEELAIRGHGHAAEDPALRAAVCRQAGDGAVLTDAMSLFAIDLTKIIWTRWSDGAPSHITWTDPA